MTSGELFDGAWAPFAARIWFVKAPFAQAAATVRAWKDDLTDSAGPSTFTRLNCGLVPMLERLEPWAMPSWRQLLVATDGDEWTAVFSQGSDIYTESQCGRLLGVPGVRTHHSPHVKRDGRIISYGDTSFWWHENGRESRTVQVSHQHRWQWNSSGEPFDFEDIDRYRSRRIVDRFDLGMLNNYCAAVGIRRADPNFYGPRALLVEADTGTWPGRPRMLTRAEWFAANR